jgi:uncharacterized protein (DUF1501 family)
MQNSTLSRRRLLLASSLALGAGTSRVWAQAAPPGNKGNKDNGRLVVVLLRGAYDGLSAFVPYADADYYSSRPNIAIAAPDGSNKTALKLDNTFALHPALAPVLPLWQQGVLSFVPSAGLPAPNRSHFAAQYEMEIGQSGKTSAASGWLNKAAGSYSKTMTSAIGVDQRSTTAIGVDQRITTAIGVDQRSTTAIGVGEANPAILAGDAQVKLIPRGQAAERPGVLANDKTRSALMDLYAGNDKVSEAFRQGAGSRMQSAQELSTEKTTMDMRRDNAMRGLDKDGAPATAQAQNAQMLAASNGASDPVGLQLDAQHLGTLMRNDRNLALGFLSAGGWDTHANQGSVTGQLANNLGNLGRGIAQLRQDFSEPGDVVVVMSEFGRTAVENGTRGTDHGYGNAMWLVGNRVNGGRWHGQWTGLARGNLNEARDLPAHHDYRAVLAHVMRSTFAMQDSALGSVLPNTRWDSRLDGLMRRT